MKRNAFKIFAAALSALMLVPCTSCTSQLNIRFVDKDGNDLIKTTPETVVTVQDTLPSETQAPATSGDNGTAPADATVADTTDASAETQAPATDAPGNDTPATQAPSDAAPATQAPATQAPATQAASALSSSSSKEEIVAKYIEVYNATKATGSFLGRDKMACSSVAIDGKENSLLRKTAESVMGTDGNNTYPLPPFTGDNQGLICSTKAADIETATYKDNGDGTATIKLIPKGVKNARRFSDAQGNMFNVMEDIASALANISLISWSQGDANSNVVLTSEGSYCEVTFSTSTNLMTKAEYVLGTTAEVTHANVLVFKDKSATAKFVYTMSYPA